MQVVQWLFLLTYLDKRGEEVSVREVGRESRLKASGSHGESDANSLLA